MKIKLLLLLLCLTVMGCNTKQTIKQTTKQHVKPDKPDKQYIEIMLRIRAIAICRFSDSCETVFYKYSSLYYQTGIDKYRILATKTEAKRHSKFAEYKSIMDSIKLITK